MSGLIELQQIISNSNAVDKIQHSKQETQVMYEQIAAAEMKTKNEKKKREIHKSNETEETRIREKNRGENKNKKRNLCKKHQDEQQNIIEDDNCGHLLDILA